MFKKQILNNRKKSMDIIGSTTAKVFDDIRKQTNKADLIVFG